MPYGRCPTQSANAGVLAGSLIVAFVITKTLSNYFNHSSNIIDLPAPMSDMPALVAVPRSMGPFSTYTEYLAMLRTNNTQCFPTEEPLDRITKLYMGLAVMFALLAKVSETAFDLTSTFSPLLNDFIAKPVIATSVLGSLLSAGVLWTNREEPMLSAWYVARVTIPALVQSMVSNLVDKLVQHLFGENTTSTTAEQTQNLPEHQCGWKRLVLVTILALTRILLEFLLRYGEDLLQLPPSPQQDYHFLVFKFSALCTVPVFQYLETWPMRSSLTAVSFVFLHDTIDWLIACITESLRSPFGALVIPILDIPNLREAILTLGAIVNISGLAWVSIQQNTHYRRFEQLIGHAIKRCKMFVRPILNPGPIASSVIIIIVSIFWHFFIIEFLREWETQRQANVNTLQRPVEGNILHLMAHDCVRVLQWLDYLAFGRY